MLKGFENELARTAPIDPVPEAPRADTTVDVGAPEEAFLGAVCAGFAVSDTGPPDGAMPSDTLGAVGDVMRQFVHPAINRYLVRVDGEPAAGARAS